MLDPFQARHVVNVWYSGSRRASRSASVARAGRFHRVTTRAGPRYLLVHLTAAGLVTDYDVVER